MRMRTSAVVPAGHYGNLHNADKAAIPNHSLYMYTQFTLHCTLRIAEASLIQTTLDTEVTPRQPRTKYKFPSESGQSHARSTYWCIKELKNICCS